MQHIHPMGSKTMAAGLVEEKLSGLQMLPFVASMPGGNVKTLLKHLNSASFAARARLIKAFASHSGAHSSTQAHPADPAMPHALT
jgi:hypothetical protein